MYFFESLKLFQWNFFFLSLDNICENVQITDATVSPTGKQNIQKPPPILHPLTSSIPNNTHLDLGIIHISK